ncbi:MAG: segregation and condensation protein A [Caulobacteraceae bacterium]
MPDLFEFAAAEEAAAAGEALILDLDGYEGPLDVLLALARGQKVDLLTLSVTRLAEQYLAFVRRARQRRFGLAADYLVMAAWLAWLKSRLLLPRDQRGADEAPPEQTARQLTWRLAKLAAMRDAAAALEARAILGRDVFTRGDPQALTITGRSRLDGDLYALMAAYVDQRKRQGRRRYRPDPQQSYPLDDARARLRRLLPELERWTALTGVAPLEGAAGDGPTRASFIASTLSASLELVREGDLEARQLEAFAEIYVRARRAA